MSICAIIVSYHPSEEIIENISALIDQVDKIVIVDNGSGAPTRELFAKLNYGTKLNIIYLEENIGIAKALNIAVKKAKIEGYQWIATFDQDSQATLRMIETMLQVYEIFPEKEKVASLSPRYKDKNTGQISGSELITSHRCGKTLLYEEARVVITSGNLVKLSIFDEVGYFNENFFIDFVDNEFSLRCITQGYKILEVKDAILVHNIGFPTQHRLLWKKPTVTNHSALRRYYFTRNAIYTYKKFAFKYPIWVIRSAYALIKVLAAIVIFEENRKTKLTAIFLGFIDGIFNKMGRCKHVL